MGKDDQPKHRQAARELRRRSAQRQPADRLLIVCEGSKTEPLYLEEILIALRDDRHLLDDPEGLLSVRSSKCAGQQPRAEQDRESLYPGGFTAARFVEVIEQELVWASA